MNRFFNTIIIVSILLGFSFLWFDDSTLNSLLIQIISFPLAFIVSSLRTLSLMHPLLNILAWIIFLFIGSIPLLVLYRIKKLSLLTRCALITLSAFTYFSVFGLLNYSFVKPMMSWSELKPVMMFMISLIILGLIGLVVLLHVSPQLKKPQTSFKLLQWISLVSAIFLSSTLFLPYQELINTWSSSMDHFFVFYQLVFNSFIACLLLVILKHIIHLLEIIQGKTFSAECIKPLQSLQSTSILLFFSALGGPLLIGILNLIFFHSLGHVSVSLDVPWFEMIFALLINALSSILFTGIKTTEENEGFI
ncbi:MAG: hypothetical protein LRY28_01595 [Erysipelotrichaceae bacterium]|nr:hypothetical protein [Erysipelotrichaceae bacterium]